MTPASKSARAPKPTAGQKAKAASDAHKTVARNRKATHDYFIEDRYEAGLVLTGTEVKALRMGRASLTEAWIEIDRHGEAWLQGAHIPEYLQGTWNNHSPRRKRKLLLHRSELERLATRVQAKGYTVVPLELYFIGGRAKLEIALARGKQDWDKRQALREAQDKREAARAMAACRSGSEMSMAKSRMSEDLRSASSTIRPPPEARTSAALRRCSPLPIGKGT